MADRKLVETGEGLMGTPARLTPEATQDVPAAITKLISNLSAQILSVVSKINGGLSLGDGSQSSRTGNLNGQWIEWKFSATPDSEEKIPHSLGRVPVGYEICRRDRACIVYDANTGGWGVDKFYLSCNTASALVKFRVY